MLDHPVFLDLLFDELSAFSDADGALVMVAPGVVDRFEMADRVYLSLASRLPDGELDRRLAAAFSSELPFTSRTAAPQPDLGVLFPLVVRVEWRSLTVLDGLVNLAPAGVGESVTVLSLAGLVALREACE